MEEADYEHDDKISFEEFCRVFINFFTFFKDHIVSRNFKKFEELSLEMIY